MGLQRRAEPVGPVPGDAAEATWELEVDRSQDGDERGAVDPAVLDAASEPGRVLLATLSLTGGDGGPRYASLRPPAISWTDDLRAERRVQREEWEVAA